MELGFVGLGIMGRPMALNLIKGGHRLRVFSRRVESMAPLVEAGALACASPMDAARDAQIVFSMLPDAPDVEQVALGPQGIAQAVGAGQVFVDMSTIAPVAAQRIATELAQHGIEMLDAPVSGGEAGAISGQLTIMVGGSRAAVQKVQPVLACMGHAVTHVGASGAGQVAKACNQIITGMAVEVLAEAFNFARANGVDGAPVREALLGGFAHSRILDNHGARMLARNFKPGFKSWMHQKDLRIVMEEAHRLGLALPGAAATAQMFNAMVGSGMGEEDSVAVLKLLQQLSRLEEPA